MNTEGFGPTLFPSLPTPYLLAEQLPLEQLETQMQQVLTNPPQDPELRSTREAWAHIELGLRQPDYTYAKHNFDSVIKRTQPSYVLPEEFIGTDTLVLRSFCQRL